MMNLDSDPSDNILEKFDDLRSFLQGHSRSVWVAFANRAVLRVLPVVAFDRTSYLAVSGRAASRLEYLSAAFRALALAWNMASFPESASKHRIECYRMARVLTGPWAGDGPSFSVDIAALANAPPSFVKSNYTGLDYDDIEELLLDFAVKASFFGRASDSASDKLFDSIWLALVEDIQFISNIPDPEALAAQQLWGGKIPSWVRKYWKRLIVTLPSEQDWDVWIRWYEDRLAGGVRSEQYELVFASVPNEIWEQGPAAANRWIKEHLPKEGVAQECAKFPQPLLGAPSPFAFGWKSGQVTIVSGPQNLPVFPYASSERDHTHCLEACRQLAERLSIALAEGQYNVRRDYHEALQRYQNDLPSSPGSGNLMLADQEARVIREMFAADADVLPTGFASRLKGFLQQHTGLRIYYPEIARFYEAVQKGRLEKPLPQDAIDAVGRIVAENTPKLFTPEVSLGLKEVHRQVPVVLPLEDVRRSSGLIQPPPDPLGELVPTNAEAASKMGTINSLWNTFLKGKDVPEAVEGWEKTAGRLAPYIEPILEALKSFMSGNG